MSEQKHTPPPWSFSETGEHAVLRGPGGDSIGAMLLNTGDRFEEEQRANAQLMTASPTLFKAAEYAIEVYQSHAAANPISAGMEKALAGLKEAVSQAKGET